MLKLFKLHRRYRFSLCFTFRLWEINLIVNIIFFKSIVLFILDKLHIVGCFFQLCLYVLLTQFCQYNGIIHKGHKSGSLFYPPITLGLRTIFFPKKCVYQVNKIKFNHQTLHLLKYMIKSCVWFYLSGLMDFPVFELKFGISRFYC